MTVMTADADADTVALLERALDQTAGLIAAIEPGQAGLSTPCAGWDVRALVSHLTGQDLRNFLISARGESADWQVPAEEIGDDWAVRARAEHVVQAEPGQHVAGERARADDHPRVAPDRHRDAA